MLPGSPIIGRDRVASELHPAGFGFSLNHGEALPPSDFGRYLSGDLAPTVQGMADIFGFVRAQFSPCPLYYEDYLLDRCGNGRLGVNTLPHRDSTSFVLAADGPRSERTVIAPRDQVYGPFWDALLATVPVSSPSYAAIADARRDTDEVLTRVGYVRDATSDDAVGRRLSRLINLLSRDWTVRDETLFRASELISAQLREHGAGHEIKWDTGVVVWISQRTFHYRLCQSVDEISESDNSLFRRTYGW